MGVLDSRARNPEQGFIHWVPGELLSCFANDSLLRQILGLSPVRAAYEKPFHYKTLSQNVCRVDEELLQQINALVAQAGRAVFKKKPPRPLNPSGPRRTRMCWKPTSIFPRT